MKRLEQALATNIPVQFYRVAQALRYWVDAYPGELVVDMDELQFTIMKVLNDTQLLVRETETRATTVCNIYPIVRDLKDKLVRLSYDGKTITHDQLVNSLKRVRPILSAIERGAIGAVKKGAFHKWLGKSEDSPITDADIKKGLAADDPHVRKMANFARQSKRWRKK
jgi:hypothetical protein